MQSTTIWLNKIDQQRQKQLDQNLYRHRVANIGGNQRHIQIDGKQYLNFASNDYLGMSHNKHIIQAWQEGANRFGLGSGGSGHVTGYSAIHQQFEEQLADWLGYSRAVLFTSGFAANQALIYSLADNDDVIIADKLSHASIQEAAHLKCCHYYRFKHNDMSSLTAVCQKTSRQSKPLIISEGVFSMDGDLAPLFELQQISTQYQGWLVIDDAHGIGVLGENGKGSCDLHNIKPDTLIITFGKAFGLNGAAILCDEPLAELLIQKARHLIYSTNMPIAQAYALQEALAQIKQADDSREKLYQNIAIFKQLIQSIPLKLTDSKTAIQPLIVGDNGLALDLAYQLQKQGIWLTAIRPPTVPSGQARLRITLSSYHEENDIYYLIESLAKCLTKSKNK